VFALRGEG